MGEGEVQSRTFKRSADRPGIELKVFSNFAVFHRFYDVPCKSKLDFRVIEWLYEWAALDFCPPFFKLFLMALSMKIGHVFHLRPANSQKSFIHRNPLFFPLAQDFCKILFWHCLSSWLGKVEVPLYLKIHKLSEIFVTEKIFAWDQEQSTMTKWVK